ncbi:MAG: hypothetical protein WC683_20160 [bacterium]
MIRRLKTWSSHAAMVLSVLGIVTFSLFIFEEAIQMTTFGTWPAQQSGDWHLVLEGTDAIEAINWSMKIVNYSVGWLQPLAFFTYRSFGKATDYYVKSLRRKIFAHAPECFVGREMEFVFTPARIETGEGGPIRLVNGRLSVLTDAIPNTRKIRVAGVVKRDGDLLVIRADSIQPVPE